MVGPFYGIPLGFYTSQWLSNWYLQGLDHFIKEQLCAVHYMRYMDDMVVFRKQQEGFAPHEASNFRLSGNGAWLGT